ncbi:MAG: host attachment protein [Bdellovibrionia bacterium]
MGKQLVERSLSPITDRKWYLVAERSQVRIYQQREDQPFSFLTRLENPLARMTESELVSDRPGRGFGNTGKTSAGKRTQRHGYDNEVSQHTHVVLQFTRRVATFLKQSAQHNEYTELIVLAEPRLLGLLRRALPDSVRARITHEIPHEFAQGSDQALYQYICQKLKF